MVWFIFGCGKSRFLFNLLSIILLKLVNQWIPYIVQLTLFLYTKKNRKITDEVKIFYNIYTVP